MSTEIIIAIIAAIGGGGIGAAIISGIFNRRKSCAEAEKTEAEADLVTITTLKSALEAQDTRLKLLGDSLDRVMEREDVLAGDIDILKKKLRGRDLEINRLTKENQTLKQRVDELVTENVGKDQEIASLRAQVEALQKQLNELDKNWRKDGSE